MRDGRHPEREVVRVPLAIVISGRDNDWLATCIPCSLAGAATVFPLVSRAVLSQSFSKELSRADIVELLKAIQVDSKLTSKIENIETIITPAVEKQLLGEPLIQRSTRETR